MSGHRQWRVVMGGRREVWKLTTEVDFSSADQRRSGADQTIELETSIIILPRLWVRRIPRSCALDDLVGTMTASLSVMRSDARSQWRLATLQQHRWCGHSGEDRWSTELRRWERTGDGWVGGSQDDKTRQSSVSAMQPWQNKSNDQSLVGGRWHESSDTA